MKNFDPLQRIERVNGNQSNLTTFLGYPVKDYDPGRSSQDGVVYRFKSDWDEHTLRPHLEHFLNSSAAEKATALVIGAWQGDDSSATPDEVVQLLVDRASRLSNLEAIFLGDITMEENEMSWIYQTDVSPLLQAFGRLKFLRTRGGESLAICKPVHSALRALTMETGGMPARVVHSLAEADLPKLEYLELWLGTEEYGGNVSVEDLAPILKGNAFPGLRYLGLRNSDRADDIAKAILDSPIASRVEVLDLSLGTLSDEGGKALLQLRSFPLKKLCLYHHYMSDEIARQFADFPYLHYSWGISVCNWSWRSRKGISSTPKAYLCCSWYCHCSFGLRI